MNRNLLYMLSLLFTQVITSTNTIEAYINRHENIFNPFSSHPVVYVTHCLVFEPCPGQFNSNSNNNIYYEQTNQDIYPESEKYMYPDMQSHNSGDTYQDNASSIYPESSSTSTKSTLYPEKISHNSLTSTPNLYKETSNNIYYDEYVDTSSKHSTFVPKLIEFRTILNEFNKIKAEYLAAREAIYNNKNKYYQSADEYEQNAYNSEQETSTERLYQLDESYEKAMRTFFRAKRRLIAMFNATAIKVAKKLGASAVHKYGGQIPQDMTILYIDPSFDITDYVVDSMNKEYQALN